MDKQRNSRENEAVIHYVIPHKGNNHLPHALHHGSLFGISAALLAVKMFALAFTIFAPSPSLAQQPSKPITASAIIYHANLTRAELGLHTLNTDAALTQAAQAKAEDMAHRGYFAHTSPEGRGAIDLLTQAGYPTHYAAENLAVHFPDAAGVQFGWMTSPYHRSNIVDPQYEDIGVGVASGIFENRNTTFVVEMFGKKRVSALTTPTSLSTETHLPNSDSGLTIPSSILSPSDVDQFARSFFLMTAAFLMSMLLLTMIVRFRLHHAASLLHASAVTSLALLLMLA